ncbi:hypothetical protein DX932_19950 [Bacillus cereus]|uniref:Integrase catalytic domain-containing protein n=1 Tax=Bacillus cereus TaxID=1396 RepID=A0A9W7Q3K5_BACCE|nr:hypothetical protein DX932_19950 [Bacillus cereus]KAB2500368.1 DDE-type integrase/transposase/recombinase [Bacillus cereus]
MIRTDQGSQYTSSTFKVILKKRGSVSSVSRNGNPYDNAWMASFYQIIKRELIQGSNFKTPEQARRGIFKYRVVLQYKKNASFFELSFSYRI